ncbi:hypothetical protein ACFL2Z_04880 [Candidatus Eisenbacteria bacterium]|uniref:Outer membrane lipoprotein-sorting protein n=1 Tax=Eiseniibacteriota bacterium TaxID=2212470 RepID=A0ABV6YQR3_UNCEI
MRKGPVFLLMLVIGPVLGLSIAASADTPTDSLWLRAVSLSEQSKDLVPGTMESYMQEVDKHGKPKNEDKYHHSWGKLCLGEDDEVEYEPVKVIKDGEDITEEEQAREREKREKEDEEDSESFTSEGYTPFRKGAQDRMSIERLDENDVVDGRDLIAYKFVELPDDEDDEEVMGTAWFDPATGVPVKMEYTTAPLPKRVKRMITTMEYTYAAPDTLIVKRMIMDATGGILFIKKHFHVEMTFDEYWRLPEGYEESRQED